jgi:large subunit ribosomal protein L25
MDVTLTAQTGRALGSRSARRLRREGVVPGVVYGLGQDTINLAVPWTDLRTALTTEAGLNALITLDVDGHEDLTIVKDLQRDPVRRDVVHVDFLRVSRDVEIDVEVPIVLEGHAEKVERDDGTVAHLLFTLHVKAKPGSIPNELTIDVSDMEIGDAIRVSDLTLPAGVTTEIDPEEVVVTAQITRATIEIAEEEEFAEALEELAEAAAEAEAAGEGAEGEGGGEPAAESGEGDDAE